MSLWYSLKVRHSKLPSYRPLVEVLEERNLLSFILAGSYPVDHTPRSVAVGDFNGDGHLDLAVGNQGSDTVSVLLGNGDGTFQDAHDYGVGSRPFCMAAADFNGDGFLDLVTANSNDGTVSVLLGNGDGTFGAAQSYAFAPHFTGGVSLAVADFNGDAHLDLAVGMSGSDTGRILLGKGDGTFQDAQSYSSGMMGSGGVAVGDFNGDGIADLAVNDFNLNTVSVLLGKGDGTFQDGQVYLVGDNAVLVTLGDFNNDGFPDLAVANSGSYTVSVLLGNGDGTFQDAQNYAVASPRALGMGDFNGDGFLDLAVANQNSDTVTILLNAADWGGGPAAAPPHRPTLHRPVPSQPQQLVATLLGESKPEAEHPLPLASTELQLNAMRQMLVETESGQPAHPESAWTPTLLFTDRDANDAWFERLGEGVFDVLSMNWLR
jgi:FG-GAP-like repeat/FG-GAP repeat